MKRNRRKEVVGVRLAPMVKVILLCAFLGGAAVGYVLQKNKLYELGRGIKEREVALERLRWENKIRAEQLADLQLPQRLAARVRRENPALTVPPPSRVVWIAEPRVEGLKSNEPSLFVLRRGEADPARR